MRHGKMKNCKFKTGILSIILWSLIVSPLFVSPVWSNEPPQKSVKILTSFFPIYLFTLNITHDIDGIIVENLLPSGYGCPHDFTVSPGDIKKIHQADIIIENGLGLETFMTEAIRTGNSRASIIVATDGVKPLKLRYYDPHDATAGDTLLQYNPHVFASPEEAALMVDNITGKLAESLPQFSAQLLINGKRYKAALDSVSREFKDSLVNLKNPRAVSIHEVLDYMARDYGFEITDVIEKEPGQDPSAKEMVELVASLKREKVSAIFSEPQYSSKAADVIAAELKIPVYEIDPLASGSGSKVNLNYYQVRMRNNLKILQKALKGE